MTRPARKVGHMSRAAFGSVQDLGNGKKRLRYWADLCDGKGYRRVSETVTASKREAAALLARRQLEHSGDGPVPTVREAFETWWLPDAVERLKAGEMARSTLDNYVSRWRAHISPAFGDTALTGVRPLDVQAWLLTLTHDTAVSSLSVLSQVYRFAVMYGACRDNPAELRYRMPRAKAREHSRRVYTLAELEGALDACEGSPAWVPAVLCGLGSCRVGEALGCRREDVSRIEAEGMGLAVVRIERQLDRSGHLMPSLKTPQSERPAIIPAPWCSALLDAPEGWLCRRADGSPLSVSTVKTAWDKSLRAAGIEPIPLRNLRASWRTIARWELGIDEDMCEKMMGHAGRGIGERHYDRPEAEVFAEAVAYGWKNRR